MSAVNQSEIYTDFIVKICITIHGYDDVYVVLYDCGWNFYFKISWQ